MLRLLRLLCVAVLLSFPAGAAEPVSAATYFTDSVMPEAKRKRLAGRILGDKLIVDAELDDYFHHINTLLAADDDYLIVGANTPQVNAFAHYGGIIVMFRGLIELTEDEDEFLGVVAHEMGHVKLDHFKKQYDYLGRSSILSLPVLIAGLMVDDADAREALIAGGTGLFNSKIYAYSRELEHEADIFGLNAMLSSMRDGRMLAKILSRMGGAANDYNSTHPAPLRRGDYLAGRLRDVLPPPPSSDVSFYLLREKLSMNDILAGEFETSHRRIIADSDLPRDVLTARYGLLLLATKTRDDALGQEMTALLKTETHPYIMRAVADNLQSRGDKDAALTLLAEGRELHPDSAAVALGLLRLLERTKRNRRAMELFDELPLRIKERSDVMLQAGRSAAHLNQRVLSNYLLAAGHAGNGNFEQAEKQILIAEKFKDGDLDTLAMLAELKRDVEKELKLLREISILG